MRPRFLVDTNLLVLFVTGTTHRALIQRHKNTQRYQSADYDKLLAILHVAAAIATTPNIATETSNLLRQIAFPYSDQLSTTFARLMPQLLEFGVGSAQAASDPHYRALGLADAATLQALQNGCHLLTADDDLFAAAAKRGLDATHFDRLQPGYS